MKVNTTTTTTTSTTTTTTTTSTTVTTNNNNNNNNSNIINNNIFNLTSKSKWNIQYNTTQRIIKKVKIQKFCTYHL